MEKKSETQQQQQLHKLKRVIRTHYACAGFGKPMRVLELDGLEQGLKVVTWNVMLSMRNPVVEDSLRWAALADGLCKIDADVVSLQEVTADTSYAYLANHPEIRRRYYFSCDPADAPRCLRNRGLLFLAKWSMATTVLRFGKTADKSALIVRLGPWNLMNVHLPVCRRPDDLKIWTSQFQKALAGLERAAPKFAETIILGDFNTDKNCLDLIPPCMSVVWRTCRGLDPCMTIDRGTNRIAFQNMQRDRENLRLDRVYVSSRLIKPRNVFVLPVQNCSDHYPLLVEFTLSST